MSNHRISGAALVPAWVFLLVPFAGLVLATLMWAGNAVIGRGLRDAYDPLQLTFCRWSVASLFLYAANCKAIKAEWRHAQRSLGRLWIGGACGMAGYHLLQYYALAQMPASNVAVIVGITPLTVTLAEATLRRAWPRPAVVFGVSLGLGGVWLVCCGNGVAAGPGDRSWAGIAAATAAMLCWSLYSMRTARCEGLSPATAMFFMSFISSLMLLPFFLYDLIAAGMRVPNLLIGAQLLYLGIPASVLAYVLYDRGIEKVGKVIGAQFNCLIPAFASALATIFLGETLTKTQVVGLIAVVIALNIVLLGNAGERHD
jgi:drug/metabolite transporter (DMT)-like permease